MATPTELANDAITRCVVLRIEFELFRDDIADLSLPQLREQFAVLESHVTGLRKEAESAPALRQANAVLEEKVAKLERRAEDDDRLRERLAIVESLQADTTKAKDEADKRRWQFVYIFVGTTATLFATIVVQLGLLWVKK